MSTRPNVNTLGAVLVLSLLLSPPASATPLYRCTSPDGTLTWQQRPCPHGKAEQIAPQPPLTRKRPTDTVPAHPTENPAIEREVARIDQRLAALEAERQRLREELAKDLAALTNPAQPPESKEHTARERPSRGQRTTERSRVELHKERERRYRAELRLLEKQIEALTRERQLLLRGR